MFIFGVSSGVKGQKMTQNDKTLSAVFHISGIIHYMIVIFGLVHMCNMMTSSDAFFIFFLILIFTVVRRVKWQKNDKKFCLSHSISQELYFVWLWFLVHLCKLMISPALFFNFSKFWFFWVFTGEGKRAKNDP